MRKWIQCVENITAFADCMSEANPNNKMNKTIQCSESVTKSNNTFESFQSPSADSLSLYRISLLDTSAYSKHIEFM